MSKIVNTTGNFQTWSKDIQLIDGHILKAKCETLAKQNEDCYWVDSELDLNHYLCNNDGRLDWQRDQFYAERGYYTEGNVEDMKLVFERPDQKGQLYLCGKLKNRKGEFNETKINLSPGIAVNDDGKLVVVEELPPKSDEFK